jgi:hypothetical protein
VSSPPPGPPHVTLSGAKGSMLDTVPFAALRVTKGALYSGALGATTVTEPDIPTPPGPPWTAQ